MRIEPRFVPLALGTALAALAVPAAASAATLSASVQCAFGGAQVPVTGNGFSPNGEVGITSNSPSVSGSSTADATGAFTGTLTVPSVSDFSVHTLSLTATDAANPATTAVLNLPVVKEAFATNFPIDGKPTSRVTWRFAGFTPGKPIYGHFRYRAKTVRNFRFGMASGPCGTLSIKTRRLPATSHPGKWTVQFDQVAAYNRFTKPRRVASFRIIRTFS
jgi:hypothetical protein